MRPEFGDHLAEVEQMRIIIQVVDEDIVKEYKYEFEKNLPECRIHKLVEG